ncbi:ATP-dependent Clp protease ATP-binding subunit [Ectobacillus ponti]|uniref:ATP-dependent Clp protease ATP-binding subunit n=1 Tax=Ectobacillus ponti TaxID=2961894 RepID=A0AA41XC86_9BACI|nr:ATP-dependent Clp protease ATP-binding subunit [Ectobacillus ponti]MCP8970775.1 ATP-dependent Clp protease ATP-binding subunit [Ectobacillus ponti]
MKCQACQQQQATVRLNIRMNGQMVDKHLCHACYEREKQNVFPMGGSPFHGFFNMLQGQKQPDIPELHPVKKQRNGKLELLSQLARNLNDAAKEGRIDPVIGRDKEIERVIEILNRRNKNNPVLIGEPGVGKTAIAEGFALRIVEGKVPAKLANKEIYVLDVASLVSDTGIRGQFEQRMKDLLEELQQHENIILFIDEIHTIVGAGSAQGSMDAGNILKPALARGDLQVIGATTLKEYRIIEKDAALERRFQPVLVQEPSVDEAVQILQGLKAHYEAYHGVQIPDEVVRACVTLSHRYIQDRYLPDKAIDLLDEAGSKVNLRASQQEPGELQAKLKRIQAEKAAATAAEQYETAAQLRDKEKTLLEQLEKEVPAAHVSVQDIESIIEEKTGIPVSKLQQQEQQNLQNLQQRLAEKVIGQAQAVEKVAKAVRRGRAGLKSKTRPTASFLFAGPTGVGKTELAKTLAEEVFGDREAMIRLDMSEYMEKHSVSKLIGSPPGYVGHEEAGQLTEKVRRNPYSLLLLDEVEKAHPDVQHMFLQILEDGRLTDSQGRTVSFKDTIIIMTSNAGVAEKKKTVGFGVSAEQEQSSLLDSLTAYFKPEFLNRFDAIIPFNHLEHGDLVRIVDLLFAELRGNLAEQHIELVVEEGAKEIIAEMGYHPAFGARPLRRVIQEKVEDVIADLLLEGAVHKVRVYAENGQLQTASM